MCTQSIILLTCTRRVDNPGYDRTLPAGPNNLAHHRCDNPIWIVGRLPNGDDHEGAPHPDPRNPSVQPCELAMARHLTFQQVQNGTCSRGIESHNMQWLPDQEERLCAFHKVEDLRRIQNDVRREREAEFESANQRRWRERFDRTPGRNLEYSSKASTSTLGAAVVSKPSGNQSSSVHSGNVQPGNIGRSGVPPISRPKPKNTSSSKATVNDKAGNPKKNFAVTTTGSSAPITAPKSSIGGSKTREPTTASSSTADVPKNSLTATAAGIGISGSPFISKGTFAATKTKKGTMASGKDSKSGTGPSKGLPYHG